MFCVPLPQPRLHSTYAFLRSLGFFTSPSLGVQGISVPRSHCIHLCLPAVALVHPLYGHSLLLSHPLYGHSLFLSHPLYGRSLFLSYHLLPFSLPAPRVVDSHP